MVRHSAKKRKIRPSRSHSVRKAIASTHSPKEQGAVHTCSHCHGTLMSGATYCHHCGQREGMKMEHVERCASCGGPMDGHRKYCRHCGAPNPSLRHAVVRPFARYLMYLILFLGLMVVLYLLIPPDQRFIQTSTPKDVALPSSTSEEPVSLTIESAGCSFQDSSYQICATFHREEKSGAVIRGWIEGAQSEDFIESPAVFCQNVQTPGMKSIVAKLIANDIVLLEKSTRVLCTGTPQPFGKSNAVQVFDRVQFRGEKTYGQGRGEGVISLELGGRVRSCEINGYWVTDDDELLRPREYCHGATSTFTSHYDQDSQSVNDDPGLFVWGGPGKGKNDPPRKTFQGYLLYGLLCDPTYYIGPRYYLRGRAEPTATGLRFLWEYFNDETRPDVDVSMDFTCAVFPTGT